MAGGEAVLEPAGLGAQARLVHDVGGRAEALGELAHADAADGQLPVRGDRAVLGEEREQVAVPGAGESARGESSIMIGTLAVPLVAGKPAGAAAGRAG